MRIGKHRRQDGLRVPEMGQSEEVERCIERGLIQVGESHDGTSSHTKTVNSRVSLYVLLDQRPLITSIFSVPLLRRLVGIPFFFFYFGVTYSLYGKIGEDPGLDVLNHQLRVWYYMSMSLL